MTTSFTLYSDGGGEKHSTAASACILDDASGNRRKLLAVLGPATNNEAEICGGLIGFAALRSLTEEADIPVQWVCDSEYTLKSGTGYIFAWQRNGWKTADRKPVKNQGLWQCFLRLSRGMTLKPQHVRGHAGHRENEACDRAASWGRTNGAAAIVAGDEWSHITVDASPLGADWLLVDFRNILELLREEQADEACEILSEKIKAAPLLSHYKDAIPLEEADPASVEVERMVRQLRKLHSGLKRLGTADSRAARLALSLEQMLKDG